MPSLLAIAHILPFDSFVPDGRRLALAQTCKHFYANALKQLHKPLQIQLLPTPFVREQRLHPTSCNMHKSFLESYDQSDAMGDVFGCPVCMVKAFGERFGNTELDIKISEVSAYVQRDFILGLVGLQKCHGMSLSVRSIEWNINGVFEDAVTRMQTENVIRSQKSTLYVDWFGLHAAKLEKVCFSGFITPRFLHECFSLFQEADKLREVKLCCILPW
jgi:hypothetical protein